MNSVSFLFLFLTESRKVKEKLIFTRLIKTASKTYHLEATLFLPRSGYINVVRCIRTDDEIQIEQILASIDSPVLELLFHFCSQQR